MQGLIKICTICFFVLFFGTTTAGAQSEAVISALQQIDSTDRAYYVKPPGDTLPFKGDGYTRIFRDDGQILRVGEFKKNSLIKGKYYEYNGEGALERIYVYDEGKRIGNVQLPELDDRDVNTDSTLTQVQQMPEFPGGNLALYDYFKQHLHYTNMERANGWQGTVNIVFIVNKDGSVTNAFEKDGKRNNAGLAHEAIRIIKAMPKWIPGKQSGEAVKVWMTLPVTFYIPLTVDSKGKSKVQAPLIPYRNGGKWGFADTSGKIIVKPEYSEVNAFCFGMARVKKGDKYGYVDAKGKLVIPVKYSYASDCLPNMNIRHVAQVSLKGEKDRFFIDSIGRTLENFYLAIGCEASESEPNFSRMLSPQVLCDLTLASPDISKILPDFPVEAKFIVPDDLLKKRTAKMLNAQSKKLIQTNYKPPFDTIPPIWDNIKEFTGMFIVSKNGKYGVMDRNNKIVLPVMYDEIIKPVYSRPFFAIIKLNGLYGFIDKNGKVVVDAKYLSAEPFKDGIARVMSRDRQPGYIDINALEYWDWPYNDVFDEAAKKQLHEKIEEEEYHRNMDTTSFTELRDWVKANWKPEQNGLYYSGTFTFNTNSLSTLYLPDLDSLMEDQVKYIFGKPNRVIDNTSIKYLTSKPYAGCLSESFLTIAIKKHKVQSITSTCVPGTIDFLKKNWKYNASSKTYWTGWTPAKFGSRAVSNVCLNNLSMDEVIAVFGTPTNQNTKGMEVQYMTSAPGKYDKAGIEIKFAGLEKGTNTITAFNCAHSVDSIKTHWSVDKVKEYFLSRVSYQDWELYSNCLKGMDYGTILQTFGQPSKMKPDLLVYYMEELPQDTSWKPKMLFISLDEKSELISLKISERQKTLPAPGPVTVPVTVISIDCNNLGCKN